MFIQQSYAGFKKRSRRGSPKVYVVEAKKLGNSCLAAMSQAESYAINKRNCKRLIVTEGIRYGIYLKRDNMFYLYAYMNLTELRDDYPIYSCFGVKEALRAMTPDWDDVS